nr:MAG TPA: hypothetical protein [Caudoviricetes sp.]
MAKSGWFGGNPHTIYNSPVDTVIDAYNFELFSREYESTFYELNKGSK